MGYTTPKTDWDAADFFNVADWTRIYRNAQLANALAEIELATPIDFDLVADPTNATIATVADFNTLLANIERLRLAVAGETITGAQVEIKDDWTDGISAPVFNYSHANIWESTIDAIWDHWNGDGLTVCPTLTGNLTITTGNTATYVDCIDDGGFSVEVQGTGTLYII